MKTVLLSQNGQVGNAISVETGGVTQGKSWIAGRRGGAGKLRKKAAGEEQRLKEKVVSVLGKWQRKRRI